tara:strand:- start:164 stop:1039 length:876 start_codon:yes stop_codon:yes gene_type:complete
MKYKLLFALAIQRIIYNILIHTAGIEHYSAPLALLMIDSIHFCISVIMVTLTGWEKSPGNWKIMLLPAILAFLHNNFQFYGMLYLDPYMHQMVYQINIIFASLITPIKLSIKQRISIFVLFVGICIVLYHRDDALILPQHNHMIGIMLTIIAAASSASSNQAFEDIIKKEYSTTWARQMQMSGLGVIGSIISCIQEYNFIIESEPISTLTFILVIINCSGNIIIPFVLKYSSNVVKGFSDTLAVLMSFIISQILYHWQPHPEFYIGIVLIIIAAIMFQSEKKNIKSEVLTV